MEGMTEERFIAKRVMKLIYLSCITPVFGLLFGMVHQMSIDDVLSLIFIDILFAIVFVFYLESDRLHKKDKPDSSEDYQRICEYYTAGIIIMLIASFFPGYTAPMLILAFLLAAGLDKEQALVIMLFFTAQMAHSGHTTAGMTACYLVMALIGVLLTGMYDPKEYRRYAEMMTLALSISIPVLFYYIDVGIPTVKLLIFSFVSGVIGVLGMHFLYDLVHFRLAHFGEISLDTIVDANFHLVREIKKYSQVDYNHAVRVSRIAAHCAANIGVNVKIAAVGGFYYRLGKFGGEPFIESGVKIAQNNCFPNEIIAILSEYDGEIKPISTIESAIVHITDTLVTKFELLDQTTLSSSWNRDMVIYQTMNEESSSGIYDHSGLTMNQFIKIRDYLSKEEELL